MCAPVALAAVVPTADEVVLSSAAMCFSSACNQPKQVVVAGDRFAVVHEDGYDHPNRIVLTYFESLSGVASPSVEVAPVGAAPQVAAFPDGSLVIAWLAGAAWNVRFVDASGSFISEAIPLPAFTGTNLRVAAGSQGNWVAVVQRSTEFGDNVEIVGLRFQNAEQLSETPFLVTPDGYGPLLAMLPSDEFVVGWANDFVEPGCDDEPERWCFDPSYKVLNGRGFDADVIPVGEAEPLGPDFRIDEQGLGGSALTRSAGGEFVGAWMDHIDSDYVAPGYLVVRKLDRSGGGEADSRVLSHVTPRSEGLGLASTGDTVVVAVGQAHDDESERVDVDLFSTGSDGGAVETVLVSDKNSDAWFEFVPKVAATTEGAVLVVWSRRAIGAQIVEIVARPYFASPQILCGDVSLDGRVSALDALATLRAAVGSRYCAVALCDPNGDGQTTASDASVILRAAVGIGAEFNCPPTGTLVPPPIGD